MIRTQIYLTEDIDAALRRVSARTGRTKSDLIREALEAAFVEGGSTADRLAVLHGSAGAWSSSGSGGDYVERLRRGRLSALLAADES